MREIIQIQVGKCGNRIGNKYWSTICREHGIGRDGKYNGMYDLELEKIDVCFDQNDKLEFTPRAIIVDLEPVTEDMVKGSEYGKIFRQENFLTGQSSAGNNWAMVIRKCGFRTSPTQIG